MMTDSGRVGKAVLLELAERCEQATGPDRELDAAAHEAAGLPFVMEYWTESDTTPQRNLSHVPRYTASLDAVLTLVPEGRDFTLDRITPCGSLAPCNASIARCSGNAATPALALCAAALRTRAASPETSRGGES